MVYREVEIQYTMNIVFHLIIFRENGFKEWFSNYLKIGSYNYYEIYKPFFQKYHYNSLNNTFFKMNTKIRFVQMVGDTFIVSLNNSNNSFSAFWLK